MLLLWVGLLSIMNQKINAIYSSVDIIPFSSLSYSSCYYAYLWCEFLFWDILSQYNRLENIHQSVHNNIVEENNNEKIQRRRKKKRNVFLHSINDIG
jgi:Zn-dependent oligopeptidase